MNDFKNEIDFIQNVSIQKAKESFFESTEESTLIQALDQNKNQALVVGADIISFASGLQSNLRESVTNCALLAQLVANDKVKQEGKIEEWYNVYFDSLQKLGWAIQERSFSDHHEKGTNFETHKAILTVAATVFGPAATALAIITSTLTALEEVSEGDKKWLTIFKRESQKAKAARFQVSVAEATSDGGVMLSLMAFKLEAKNILTQVLFFKMKSSEVSLHHSSGKVTLDAGLLEKIRPALAKKIEKHALDWIEALGDLEVPA